MSIIIMLALAPFALMTIVITAISVFGIISWILAGIVTVIVELVMLPVNAARALAGGYLTRARMRRIAGGIGCYLAMIAIVCGCTAAMEAAPDAEVPLLIVTIAAIVGLLRWAHMRHAMADL